MGSVYMKKSLVIAFSSNTPHNVGLYIMPHSMDCHVFSDVSFLYIFIKKILYSFGCNVCAGMIPAVKKPLFGAVSFPVSSEDLKIGLRKQSISIFATFGVADEQLHFSAMDI